MKATKLPSGNYRCRVFYTDATGKRVSESFTYPTALEAKESALRFKKNVSSTTRHGMTVSDAVKGYIEAKENVLSPSTIRSYRFAEKHLAPIGGVRLQKLTNEIVQTYINTISTQFSPKYVKNVYSVLKSSVAFYLPDRAFRITLPKQNAPELNVPADADVKRLLEATHGWFKTAICLAGFCSMRRGEIAALKHKDIDRKNNRIHVHADFVRTPDEKWTYKETPKTQSSNRYIDCPPFVIDRIEDGPPDDFVFKIVPSTITTDFINLRDRLGINIRFHDLRAYFTSKLLAEGLPDIYVARQGGWQKNSPVMKQHYQRLLANKEKSYVRKSNKIFGAFSF